MRRLLVGCVQAALLLLGTRGRADAGAIVWEAPAECPDREAVVKKIATWLGQPSGALELGPVRARARVHREEDRWILTLRLTTPTGTSEEALNAERCEALADFVALKTSLAAEPITTVETASVVTVEPGEPERASGAAPPARPSGESKRLRFSARAAAGLGLGQLPEEAPSVGVYGSARWRWLRFELGSAYWFSRTVEFPSNPDIGAHMDLLTGIVRVCPLASLGAIEVPLCVGVEGGVVRAEGFGTSLRRTAYEPWVAVVVGPALVLPLYRGWHFWLEPDAVLGVVRPGFSVRNLGRLYRADRGSAQIWAGIECQFR